jgi:hypothetical protein
MIAKDVQNKPNKHCKMLISAVLDLIFSGLRIQVDLMKTNVLKMIEHHYVEKEATLSNAIGENKIDFSEDLHLIKEELHRLILKIKS